MTALRGYLARLLGRLFWLPVFSLPAAGLLFDGGPRVNDFYNAVWLVGYNGAYLRAHGRLPYEVNLESVGGIPIPLFYGKVLYSLLAFPAAIWDAELVLRAAAFLLFVLEGLLVASTLAKLGADRTLARATACLVVWAIYPLSNLYMRSAMAELFATGFLVCATCCWFRALVCTTLYQTVCGLFAFGLLLALAGGTHPITALLSTFVLLSLASTLLEKPRGASRLQFVGCLAGVSVLVALVFLPWAYATALFRDLLNISMDKSGLFATYDGTDWWVARLVPFPIDFRGGYGPKGGMHAALYTYAPINGPLVALTLVVIAKAWRTLDAPKRALVSLPLVGSAFFFVLSVLPAERFLAITPHVFRLVQFLYRFVTYVDLFMLVALLVVLLTSKQTKRVGPAFVTFVVTVAGCAVAMKVIPDVCVATKSGLVFRRELKPGDAAWTYKQFPDTYYGPHDYQTPTFYSEQPPNAPIVAASFPLVATGQYGPIETNAQTDTFVHTQVAPFPWAGFLVDGQRVSYGGIRYAEKRGLDVLVPAGHHVLEYRFMPTPTYVVLDKVAALALFSLLLSLGLPLLPRLVRRLRERKAHA